MEKNKFFSAKNIAYLAVLLALVIVLQAFSASLQALTVVNLNLALVPIVLGALLLGPLAGVMGINGFYTVIWSGSPFVTTLTCLVKTTVAGLVAGFVYNVIKKKNGLVATFVASGLVPIVNTVLFILGCLCMPATIQSINPEGVNLFVFIIVSIVTWNFFIEFAISLVLAPAVHRVVLVVEKQFGGKKKPAGAPNQSVASAEPAATQEGKQ